jgi:hypothetical protein
LQWTRVDPAAAADFIDEVPAYEVLSYGCELIGEWAAVDPDAAREWVETHRDADDGHERPGLVENFLLGWYERDPAAAASYTLAHASDEALEYAVKYMGAALFFDAPDDARAYMEALPTDELRHGVCSSISHYIDFQSSPEAGEDERSPRSVLDRLVQLPADYWKGTLSSTIGAWGRDTPALLAWIQDLPDPVRDSVVAEYSVWSDERVGESLRSIAAVPDAALRQQIVASLVGHWNGSTDAVASAIEASPLSAAEKATAVEAINARAAPKASSQAGDEHD